MTRFVSGAVTVQFNHDPRHGTGSATRRQQVRGRDSDGGVYAYDKSAKVRGVHRLRFDRLTDAVLDDLESFVETTVQGVRKTFTWIDHQETSRTVRFESPGFRHRQTAPDRHDIELILIEDQ